LTSAVEPKVTLDLARGLGLTADEYDRIIKRLGREPSYTELGLFSALWSEHCAYKHSKVFLRRLPQAGRRVLQGPGENAGALDIGDGWAVVFKIESHNHPSLHRALQALPPELVEFSATFFTMGARRSPYSTRCASAIRPIRARGDSSTAWCRHLVVRQLLPVSDGGRRVAFAPSTRATRW
jgi:hypothetical protein